MALIRWQPFHEMDALQKDMNRMFEALASNNQNSMRQSFMPLAEMEQTEDAVYLKVEVPGMNVDDLDVQVTREAVMITGERKSESRSQKNGMKRLCGAVSFRTEFRYGSFQRTIPLPIPVDNERVNGDYQDGILTLELPKLQKQENKVTKVNIGSGKNKSLTSPTNSSNSISDGGSSQGASNISAKEQLDTHGSSEPSANNVDVDSETGGYGNQDVWDDSQQSSEQTITN